MKYVIGIIALIAFLVTGAGFAPESECANLHLATPSTLDDIVDNTPHHKNLALAEICLEMELQEINKVSEIEGATDAAEIKKAFARWEKVSGRHLSGKAEGREDTIFHPAQITACFNEVSQVGERTHVFMVPVIVEKGDRRFDYRLLFSTVKNRDGIFPITLYTGEEFEKHTDEIITRDGIRARSEADKKEIERYRKNGEAIDSFIRERIEAGEFAEIEGRAAALGWDDPGTGYPKRIKPREGQLWSPQILDDISSEFKGFLDIFNIDFDKVIEGKNLVFIKMPEGMAYPEIFEDVKRINVEGHTSNNAMYFFLQNREFEVFESLYSEDPPLHPLEGIPLRDAFVHEIGAACGEPFMIEDWSWQMKNRLDIAYTKYKLLDGRRRPEDIAEILQEEFPDLMNLGPVDLDILRGVNAAGRRYSRDYAAAKAHPGDWSEEEKQEAKRITERYFKQYYRMLGLDEKYWNRMRVTFAYRADSEPQYIFIVADDIAYYRNPVFLINTRDCTFDEFKELSSDIMSNMCAKVIVLSERVGGGKPWCVLPGFDLAEDNRKITIGRLEGKSGTEFDIGNFGSFFGNKEELLYNRDTLEYGALSDMLAMNWIDRSLYREGPNYQVTNLTLKIKGDLHRLKFDVGRTRIMMQRSIEENGADYRAGSLLPRVARYEALLSEKAYMHSAEIAPDVHRKLGELKEEFRRLAIDMIENDGHIAFGKRSQAISAYENLIRAFRCYFISIRFNFERHEDVMLPVEIVGNTREGLVLAAREIASVMIAKPTAKIGLATGSTMRGLYKVLARYINELGIDLSKIRFYNLDEYYPNPERSIGGYHSYMQNEFFSLIEKETNRPGIVEAEVVEDKKGIKRVKVVKPGNAYIPGTGATGQDLDIYCRWYDEQADADGGLDVQLLGIGRGDRAFDYGKSLDRKAALELVAADALILLALFPNEVEFERWGSFRESMDAEEFIQVLIGEIADMTKDRRGRERIGACFDAFYADHKGDVDGFLTAFNRRHSRVEAGVTPEQVKRALMEGIRQLQPKFKETGGHIGFNEPVTGTLLTAANRFVEIYFAPELLNMEPGAVEARKAEQGEKRFYSETIEPLFASITRAKFDAVCSRINKERIAEWLEDEWPEESITFEDLREAITVFDSTTRTIDLSRTTRMANAGDFVVGGVPEQAVTRGIRVITSSKRMVLLAFGDEKSDVITEAATRSVTPRIPASILQKHADRIRIIVDGEAGKGISEDPYKFTPREKRDHAVISTILQLAREGRFVSAEELTLADIKSVVKRAGIVRLFEEEGFDFKAYIREFAKRMDQKQIQDADLPADTVIVATQPHPDDFAICVAGIGSKLTDRGNKTVILTATNGCNAVWDYFVNVKVKGVEARGDAVAWMLSKIEHQGLRDDLLRAGLGRFNKDKPLSALLGRIKAGTLGTDELEADKKPFTDEEIAQIEELSGKLESEDLTLAEYKDIARILWDIEKFQVRHREDIASAEALGIPRENVQLLDLPFYKTRNRGIKELSDEDHSLMRGALEKAFAEGGVIVESQEDREKAIIDSVEPHIPSLPLTSPQNQKAVVAVLDGIYQGRDNSSLLAMLRRDYGLDLAELRQIIDALKKTNLLEPAILMISDDIDPRGTHGLVQNLVKMHFRDIMAERVLIKPVVSMYYHGAWDEYPLAYGLAKCVEFGETVNNGKQTSIRAHESQLIPKYPGEDKRPFWQRALNRNTDAYRLFEMVTRGKTDPTNKFMEVVKFLVTLPTEQDKDLPPPATLSGLVFRPIETEEESDFLAELTGLLQASPPIKADNSCFIFSEKATFDNGLGVFLPKLIESGMKVAVIATNERQRAWIYDELSQNKERLVCEETISEIMSQVDAARYYYFKVQDEPRATLKSVTTFDITNTMRTIIEMLGSACSIIDPYEATRTFVISATSV
jgi:6-phosphogluconolactonase/glucosamine-6-phosphate isomerase/deaminase/LmbE family N-acetylglucosaminyl deacetylase